MWTRESTATAIISCTPIVKYLIASINAIIIKVYCTLPLWTFHSSKAIYSFTILISSSLSSQVSNSSKFKSAVNLNKT